MLFGRTAVGISFSNRCVYRLFCVWNAKDPNSMAVSHRNWLHGNRHTSVIHNTFRSTGSISAIRHLQYLKFYYCVWIRFLFGVPKCGEVRPGPMYRFRQKTAFPLGRDFFCHNGLPGRNPCGCRPLQNPVAKGSGCVRAGTLIGLLWYRFRQRIGTASIRITLYPVSFAASSSSIAWSPPRWKGGWQASGRILLPWRRPADYPGLCAAAIIIKPCLPVLKGTVYFIRLLPQNGLCPFCRQDRQNLLEDCPLQPYIRRHRSGRFSFSLRQELQVLLPVWVDRKRL